MTDSKTINRLSKETKEDIQKILVDRGQVVDSVLRAKGEGNIADEVLRSTSDYFNATCLMHWEYQNGEFTFEREAGREIDEGLHKLVDEVMKDSFLQRKPFHSLKDETEKLKMPYFVESLDASVNGEITNYGSLMMIRTPNESGEEPAKFNIHEIDAFFAISRAVATKLDQIYKTERAIKAEEHAFTDFLTGAYNMRGLFRELDQEFGRAVRYARPISVVMIDIDYFKKFNDDYGHPQGDQVLKEFYQVLKGCVKESDTIARYGGEEFTLILPERTLDEAYEIAEKARTAIHDYKFTKLDDATSHLKITASLGVATRGSNDDLSGKQLIKEADKKLYYSKENGRDQVNK